MSTFSSKLWDNSKCDVSLDIQAAALLVIVVCTGVNLMKNRERLGFNPKSVNIPIAFCNYMP